MKPIYFLGLFLFIFSASLCAQTVDTANQNKDSINRQLAKGPVESFDSSKTAVAEKPLFKNRLLNTNAEPVSLAIQIKKIKSNDIFFYVITLLVLLLAFLKYFFRRYFTNLFKVFFNTSLRQNQITDQLLQAKLPSFLFNIFFVVSGGVYVYVLLLQFHLLKADNNWLIIFFSIILMALVYFIKFFTLKFTGWITGLAGEVNMYVFVIFLINKIIGIFLVPFVIVMAFARPEIVKAVVLISLICIGLFLLLRFFRSYALIQNQLKISKFHFLLYITGLEILPLMLIYKGLMIYLTKNL